tara:strand:+ start:16058 stop:17068 length:1011 start_codon:yes stop_codon:yes gene_type:complete
MTQMRLLLLLMIFVLSSAPGATAESPPLEGTIWDVREGREISREELIKKLRPARFILLGERHDNIRHHQHQAWLIDKLSQTDRRFALVFEMVERHKQNAFALFAQRFRPGRGQQAPQRHDATGLNLFLDWDNSGWPDWSFYKPLFDIAYLKGLALGAAGLSRHEIGRMHQQGLEGIPEELRAPLLPYLKKPLPPALDHRLRQTIVTGHCNTLPETAVTRFMEIQRTRDAFMAWALQKHEKEFARDGAILIAGNGHVRQDLGVPYYLRGMKAEGKILSLAFLEADVEKNSLAEYTGNPEENHLPYNYIWDYIWFTAQQPRPDPCAIFKNTSETNIAP